MKAKTSQKSEKNAAARPSLYNFGGRSRESGEIFSILDALEPRRRKGAIWWRTALIGLVAVLSGVLYLVGRDVDLYRSLSPVASNEVTLGRTVVELQTGEAAPAPAVFSREVEGAAAIVVEPLQQAGMQMAAVTEKVESQAAEVLPAAAPGSPVAAPEQVSSRRSHIVAVEHTSTRKTVLDARKPESKPAPRAGEGTQVARRKGKDSDVDLIAALVAHVSGTEQGSGAVRKNDSQAPAGESVAANARTEQRVDAGRDIVVRNGDDSTAKLVARCRALGLIEGELCRLRICSGLWGIDPACPGTPSGDRQLTSGR